MRLAIYTTYDNGKRLQTLTVVRDNEHLASIFKQWLTHNSRKGDRCQVTEGIRTTHYYEFNGHGWQNEIGCSAIYERHCMDCGSPLKEHQDLLCSDCVRNKLEDILRGLGNDPELIPGAEVSRPGEQGRRDG